MRMRILVALAVVLSLSACGAQEKPADSPAEAPVPATGGSDEGPAPAPGPSEVHERAGQQVALDHCGVQPLNYQGERWEVEDAPFDLNNAPETFTGFGTFSRAGDVLTFSDRAGAELTFTPADRTRDPGICA